MTMNLTRNYVEIEEAEMMYLDGGWEFSSSIFCKNMRGINSWLCKHAPSKVLQQTGISRALTNLAKYYAGALYARIVMAGLVIAKCKNIISGMGIFGNWNYKVFLKKYNEYK